MYRVSDDDVKYNFDIVLKVRLHLLQAERGQPDHLLLLLNPMTPTDLNDDGSLAYRQLFSETNVRHAQDLLLLAQIEWEC